MKEMFTTSYQFRKFKIKDNLNEKLKPNKYVDLFKRNRSMQITVEKFGTISLLKLEKKLGNDFFPFQLFTDTVLTIWKGN